MKRESAKIYDKSSQIQKRKQLTKEGVVSFLEFSHKNRKAKKSCHRKNNNYGSRKEKFPNWMKVDEMETYLLSYTC